MHDELSHLRETVARQQSEIEALRARLAQEQVAQNLREALSLASLTGAMSSPVAHTRLLEMIVETAADIISANAAALFLIDEEEGSLRFEVAIGQKASEVKGFRVPLGHGIAGLVAVTGQPMAVSDTQSDPRHAADIARSIGYAPRNVLCVPLVYDDQVIGVLELLDKIGAPSFRPEDMETLALFANQAAVTIAQSRTHQRLTGLVSEALNTFRHTDAQPNGIQTAAVAFATNVEADPAYQEAFQLAQLVREVARQGEPEREACTAILRGFVTYLRGRPDLSPATRSYA